VSAPGELSDHQRGAILPPTRLLGVPRRRADERAGLEPVYCLVVDGQGRAGELPPWMATLNLRASIHSDAESEVAA
jgi:hypothetical protein